MGPVIVGVCDSNVVFETGVLACMTEDPTIEVHKVDAHDVGPGAYDVIVTSPDNVDLLGSVAPLVLCADVGEDAMGDAVAAVLPRSTVTPDQLIGAVHAAGVGLRLNNQPTLPTGMDQRSIAVLGLLADGASTKDISVELGYSERTVKAVVASIGAQLGSRTRAHSVATALRQSLIT